ncbi:peptidogalycan biosysnthesis protein [Paraburkholderia sp. CNPSo 3076]|uniref:peptidogalycan biosysnthesis protein n=1 Tax=Paraburkholderia sp. CNPSo 3076 TaxID=2940936 RepID=UPI002B1DB0A2|nr:peptidogalycan biosysnthesis protein [Paraburkholderia sp. CNPSo 3076]
MLECADGSVYTGIAIDVAARFAQHASGTGARYTRSAHWLAHPAFSDAVARFLESETNHIHAYMHELNERNPFRA